MCRPDSCPTASPPLPGPTADEGFCQPVVLLSSAARQGMIHQQAWFLHRMNEGEGKKQVRTFEPLFELFGRHVDHLVEVVDGVAGRFGHRGSG